MVAAYATAANVEALVGDLVTARSFGASTIPTSTQLTSFLSITAATINVALQAAGYTTPVVAADDPFVHEWLVNLNACGAAVYVLSTMPTTSYSEPGEESPSQGRRQFFENVWRTGLKRIEQRKLSASGLVSDRNYVISGSAQDSSGTTKVAIFSREVFDFPGGRDLTP